MTTPRRTRIVATLGPATDPPEVLAAILAAGVDVVRINFSHGTADEHKARIARVRSSARSVGKEVAVLADLPGPKLRVRLPAALPLARGQEIAFAVTPEAEASALTVTEPFWLTDVRPGHRILLDDGRLQLTAVGNEHGRLTARVEVGGQLLPGKGVNLPDTSFNAPALTDRDRVALAAAAAAGADWVAVSFVRGPEAADEVRAALAEHGAELPVMAKVERPEAVRRAAAIVLAFDAVMVARGDLGVELPLEDVPSVQKRLITLARQAGKPVVTATDMLDSMRGCPRPTRAEASDVANAIFDGTDAVMLSGETAAGQYPVDAVTCMDRIARAAERYKGECIGPPTLPSDHTTDEDRLAHAACVLAGEVSAAAIVTPSLTGRTARLVARYRPAARVVAPTPHEAVLRRMAVLWGVCAVPMEPGVAGDDRMAAALRAAFQHGQVHPGERAVILAGHPVEGGEQLPTLRLVCVGEGGKSREP
jgi:pyruvate kinase